ncbi:uncharacterized protein LOC112095040, partial [Morus notabilis]|uniref:uncharacterized protein LOC112095040 n=1 Tax=Morus notabilis TaxID=981085 RepID=UPI000CED22E5
MESGTPILLCPRFMIALVVLIFSLAASNAKSDHLCPASSCGNIPNISRPFRLKTDPEKCGHSRYELSCEHNLTLVYFSSVKYLVKAINYNNNTIRVVDANVHKDNCSSLPKQYFDFYPYQDDYETRQEIRQKKHQTFFRQLTKTIIFLRCENRVNSHLYVDTAPCFNVTRMFRSKDSANYSSQYIKRQSDYYYYVVDGGLNASDLDTSCRMELKSFMAPNGTDIISKNTSYMDIHNALADGFELTWLR